MTLTDHHNRFIDYLRVSVTDRCNLSCTYCKPRARMTVLPHQEILQYEEMLRIISLAAHLGISHVRVTGGEPLVRRGLLPFIASIHSIPEITDVSITTNGILLSENAAGLRSAGISRLNVSLDSLNAAKFAEITGSADWDKVWNGIRLAEELGFHPIKINMVPVKGINDGEVADFARLTLTRRVHVRFIEFMPIGANDRWHMDKCVTSDQIREHIEREIGSLIPFAGGTNAGPSTNYQIAGATGVIGLISPISKHFCATCRRLRLTADGKIRPCLLSDTEIDIKSPMRRGCNDKELERLLRLAIEIKPEHHKVMDAASVCGKRTMSMIGG